MQQVISPKRFQEALIKNDRLAAENRQLRLRIEDLENAHARDAELLEAQKEEIEQLRWNRGIGMSDQHSNQPEANQSEQSPEPLFRYGTNAMDMDSLETDKAVRGVTWIVVMAGVLCVLALAFYWFILEGK